MTFLIIGVWLALMFFIYKRFLYVIDGAAITFQDEEGNDYTEERYVLNNNAMFQIVIAIIWTAFSFWLVGRQMISYMYYY